MCLSLLLFFSFPLAGESATIRVGLYPLDAYQYFDDQGQACGYAVDYLDRISLETGWDYEYVPLDSWLQGEKMLQEGEIDLLSPAETRQERVDSFLFSDGALGGSFMTISTKDENIPYEDYEAISKMRISVEKGTSLPARYRIWAKEHGISPDNLVEYDNYDASIQAVQKGKVDAILCSAFSGNEGLHTVCKMNYSEFYFLMNHDAHDLKDKLDQAMTDIMIKDPDFRLRLMKKHFPDIQADPITKEEQDKIKSSPAIRIAVPIDRRPMTYRDKKGQVQGIAIELLDDIAKRSGLSFTYVPFENGRETAEAIQAGDCQVKIPAGMPANRAYGLKEMVTSTPLMDFSLSVVSVGGRIPLAKEHCSVGVTADSIGMGKAICQAYPHFVIQEYKDWDSACSALLKGEVDSVAVNSTSASYLLQKPKYASLRLVSSISIPTPVSLGAPEEYGWVISVIDKCIKTMDKGMVQNTITKYTSMRDYEYTTSDYLYRYRHVLTLLSVVFMLIFSAIVLYRHRRMAYEKELLKSNRELQTATEAKKRFYSQLSHDIRTPMNGILGVVETTKGCGETAKYEEALDDIQTTSVFLMSLINDVLDLSKISNNKFTLDLEPYSFQEFKQSVSAIMEEKATKKGVTFSITSSNFESGWAMMDKTRIQQIFVNLLGNAIKFTPKGGHVSLSIAFEETETGKGIITSILTDNGCGMSKEFVEHKLYEEFEQERNDNNRESGTGLGMSIVKHLIDAMKGTITCDSELGKGTTFTVRLPITKTEEPEKQPEIIHSPTIALEGRRILLCEDHPLNTKIAIRILEKGGMTTDHAENGQIGVDKFVKNQSGTYDAILMDIRMPVMDGLAATKAIRQSGKSDAATIPIIAMSANAFEEDVQTSLKAGMNAHLSKPIDAETLYRVLAKQIADISQ